MLTDLPLCFDEVGAGDSRIIERSIYMLINGAGKSRGDRALRVRKTPTWRTVVLSTGEHELADERANTGAQVRVLQFRVSGFRRARRRRRRRAARGVRAKLWTRRATLDRIARSDRGLDAVSRAIPKSESAVSRRRTLVPHGAPGRLLRAPRRRGTLGARDARARTGGRTDRPRLVYGHKAATRDNERELARRRSRVRMDRERTANVPVPRFQYVGRPRSADARKRPTYRGRSLSRTRYLLPNELRARLTTHGISSAEVIAAWSDSGFLECDSGKRQSAHAGTGNASRFTPSNATPSVWKRRNLRTRKLARTSTIEREPSSSFATGTVLRARRGGTMPDRGHRGGTGQTRGVARVSYHCPRCPPCPPRFGRGL